MSSVDEIHPCYTPHGRAYTFIHIFSVKCVIIYVCFGLLSVVTVCGNVLVIVSVVYFKQLHIPTNYLILSLAVADLLVGLLVFPFSMARTVTSCFRWEDLLCKIREIFDVVLCSASILNLCCISIDRYCAVCQPLTYKSKISDGIIGVMILVSWGVAAAGGIYIVYGRNADEKCDESCLTDAVISNTLSSIFCFYLPVIVMLKNYLNIFFVARKQAKKIQNAKPGPTVSKMERKATKTLAIVMGLFFLCWTPYFLCVNFQPLIPEITSISVIEALGCLALLNSMFNPFIYAFFYSWFRSAFRIIMSGKILHSDLSNTKLL